MIKFKIGFQTSFFFIKKYLVTILISSIVISCTSVSTVEKEEIPVAERVKLVKTKIENEGFNFDFPRGTHIDSIGIDSLSNNISVYFNKNFSFMPFRDDNVKLVYDKIKSVFGPEFKDYSFKILSLEKPIEELIPNYFRRDHSSYDFSRLFNDMPGRKEPVVKNISKKFVPSHGLYNRNIVLWHSHGWYYNLKTGRWEWQRPRLYQTVEDKLPMSVTLPYLIPMLENAGANVFVPRERDLQNNEIIIDNDSPEGLYKEYPKTWKDGAGPGFMIGQVPYPVNFNPFDHGTHRIILAESKPAARAVWEMKVKEPGFYAVYITYGSSEFNVSDAHYSVYHEGGVTKFLVNQQIGGNTWQYLGSFKFGQSNDFEGVILTNESKEPGNIVSADAVRFGGGKGVVERGGSTSGRPKYLEGARYYLQYTGMPDTLVYSLNDLEDDYKDDYQSRAEYANYLRGAPFGPNQYRYAKGLGIPIDLSLAFHTDAGVTKNDTVIGTLAIYSVLDADSQVVYPNGVSRFANRDFADIVQSQIVNDVKAKYDPAWNRRQLYEAQYSEAFRPNIPSMLLEMLSHQNFLDMKFMLDPRFRFDIARSIYKGMLKFLSVEQGFDFVVQPLPPAHFLSNFDDSGNIKLSWQAQIDKLEPSSSAQKYMIYTRINDGGFDNGLLLNKPEYVLTNPEEGTIYSFKVTAVNEGGESFPSEILSACKTSGAGLPVLIINGFDRICGPASIQSEKFSGFLDFADAGVPDKYKINFTGSQYDFDPGSKYVSNDSPGHGASYSDMETEIIAGNTFDYPLIHGKAIKDCGYSFVSCSDEAVIDSLIDMKSFRIVDLILGEEKETGWPKSIEDTLIGMQFKTIPRNMQQLLTGYLLSGGNIFISGAYAASDLSKDSIDVVFANNILKFEFDTDHASRKGTVIPVPLDGKFKTGLTFNTKLNSKIYSVESPDAVYPVNGSNIIYRYKENMFGAATAYKNDYGVVVFGFPFETIIGSDVRKDIMMEILNYFGK